MLHFQQQARGRGLTFLLCVMIVACNCLPREVVSGCGSLPLGPAASRCSRCLLALLLQSWQRAVGEEPPPLPSCSSGTPTQLLCR